MTDTLELLKQIDSAFIKTGKLTPDRKAFRARISVTTLECIEAKIAELEAEPKSFTEAEQAIDDALVCCHLGTLNDFPTIKHALAAVERWHYDLGASGVCEPATHKLVASMENPYGREYRPVEPPTAPSGFDGIKWLEMNHGDLMDCVQNMATTGHTGNQHQWQRFMDELSKLAGMSAQPTEDLGAVMEKYGIDVFESLKGQWAAVHIEGYTLRDTPREAVLALRDKLEGD